MKRLVCFFKACDKYISTHVIIYTSASNLYHLSHFLSCSSETYYFTHLYFCFRHFRRIFCWFVGVLSLCFMCCIFFAISLYQCSPYYLKVFCFLLSVLPGSGKPHSIPWSIHTTGRIKTETRWGVSIGVISKHHD